MNTLKEKAENNLKYILEMGENDTFISERGKLVPQNDFVQVNNVVDLEYAIYFTFHQYLLSDNINKIYNHKLIEKLDLSIDKLYDNKQFNELIGEEHFSQIMDDIDNNGQPITNNKDELTDKESINKRIDLLNNVLEENENNEKMGNGHYGNAEEMMIMTMIIIISKMIIMSTMRK